MEPTLGLGYAALGAGISLGLAGAGTAIGLGFSGVAGTGIVSEDPKKFGNVLVWNALPQTQMIYGFLMAILIMLGAGLLGGAGKPISEGAGLVALGAGIVVGVSGLSGIGQGSICGGGAIASAKRPEVFGQSLVLAVLAETPAIFGVVIAVLMLLAIGFL
jgi:V/A-type H+-transporting ATPase subunit K